MTPSYLKNVNALIHQQKYLKWLLEAKDIASLSVVLSKDRHPTCEIEGKWISSRYAPAVEAERFVHSLKLKEGDFVVLYGFGLGYHLLPILDRIGETGYLYCLESHLSLLKTALESNDYSDILSDPRFKLITGRNREELASLLDHYILWNLETIPQDAIRIVLHEPSFSVIPKDYFWIQNILEIIRFERKGDSVFWDEMKENLEHNLPVFFSGCAGVCSLSSVFGNTPVFFVGAGPSLDLTVELLNTVKTKGIIVCVDTALGPLMERRIRPDFVISVDPQKKSYDNFRGYENENLNLLLLATSSKDIISRVSGSKFLAIQKDGWVSSVFEHRFDHYGLTYGGSAVSVIGVDLVLNHAKGPVFFFGMDFAFPFLKSYADFTPELDKWSRSTCPYYTLEMVSIENIYSRKLVFTDSYDGDRIPTFQSMYSYLRSLETIIDFHKRGDIYTLFPQGIKIKGVLPLSSHEFQSKLTKEAEKAFKISLLTADSSLIDFCMNKINSLKSMPLLEYGQNQ